MLRYKTTKPGLVALYDIRPGNGAGLFLQPGARTGLLVYRAIEVGKYITQGQKTTQTHNKTMKKYNKPRKSFGTLRPWLYEDDPSPRLVLLRECFYSQSLGNMLRYTTDRARPFTTSSQERSGSILTTLEHPRGCYYNYYTGLRTSIPRQSG